MAHEIDMSQGTAAVMTVGELPWHGLGQSLEHAVRSDQALTLAGLDWQVDQWPVQAVNPQSSQNHTAERYLANVRTDTHGVLGVVGRGYKVFQNHEAFDFMDALVGDQLAMYETAGSLKGGRKVWMLARIPREYHATAEDVIQPYVLLVNAHDGSSSLRMIPTTVRVVCNNTLNLALKHAGSEGLRIRHGASLDDRVREAREKLGIVAARFDQFDEELHAMLDKSMRSLDIRDYFHSLLPEPGTELQRDRYRRTIHQFHDNFENEKNNLPGIRGTAWAAYNAVSEWADHQRTFRGKDDFTRSENRLNSVWFGPSHEIKQKAYRHALAMN